MNVSRPVILLAFVLTLAACSLQPVIKRLALFEQDVPPKVGITDGTLAVLPLRGDTEPSATIHGHILGFFRNYVSINHDSLWKGQPILSEEQLFGEETAQKFQKLGVQWLLTGRYHQPPKGFFTLEVIQVGDRHPFWMFGIPWTEKEQGTDVAERALRRFGQKMGLGGRRIVFPVSRDDRFYLPQTVWVKNQQGVVTQAVVNSPVLVDAPKIGVRDQTGGQPSEPVARNGEPLLSAGGDGGKKNTVPQVDLETPGTVGQVAVAAGGGSDGAGTLPAITKADKTGDTSETSPQWRAITDVSISNPPGLTGVVSLDSPKPPEAVLAQAPIPRGGAVSGEMAASAPLAVGAVSVGKSATSKPQEVAITGAVVETSAETLATGRGGDSFGPALAKVTPLPNVGNPGKNLKKDHYILQAGLFVEVENALEMVQELRNRGYEPEIAEVLAANGVGLSAWRVWIGLYDDYSEARDQANAFLVKESLPIHVSLLSNQAALLRYAVQVGSFLDSGKAREWAAMLQSKGYGTTLQESRDAASQTWYSVWIGRYWDLRFGPGASQIFSG